MNRVKLLVVEDDSAQVETWRRQLERHNALNDFNYSADYAVSYDEAAKLIESNKYDAAIVDIRLQNPDGVNDATTCGNDVRDLLLRSEIVLIAHLTGEPDAVDFNDSDYRDLVKVFTKADTDDADRSAHELVLMWLASKSKIISTMRTVKANIASKMADLFYLSIWPRWDSWQDGEDDFGEFIPSSITRHITSHLYSTFLADGKGKVHPEEWYFQPASKERFHTGDLLKSDGSYYILVTPRCDLERLNDGQALMFAKMDVATEWAKDKLAADEKIKKIKDELIEADNGDKRKKLERKIDSVYSDFRKNYYGHKNGKFNLHFLPEVNQSKESVHGPFFVDFSDLQRVVVGSQEFHSMKEQKIASLSTEFLPSFVQRLGAYISRIGSPDYSHIS